MRFFTLQTELLELSDSCFCFENSQRTSTIRVFLFSANSLFKEIILALFFKSCKDNDRLVFPISKSCLREYRKLFCSFNFIVQEFSGFFKPGMNCTFSGLVSIFFLCGWGGEISFQMLSDKCYIICRFIICNIERWGKNFNKLIFFLSLLKYGFIIIYSKKNNPFSDYIFLVIK